MKPQICISALAWTEEDEPAIFKTLKNEAVQYIELIPYRARKNPSTLKRTLSSLGLQPVSFQALLFGTQDLHLFQSKKQRLGMLDTLTDTCELAQKLGVRSLVFGSPRNRWIDPKKLSREKAQDIALDFFSRMAEVAKSHSTAICMEANPKIYSANFLTTTQQAATFVQQVNHPGLRLNLDLGTIAINKENLEKLWPKVSPLLGHIQWSVPDLQPIDDHPVAIARTLAKLMKTTQGYDGIVSIEMLPGQNQSAVQYVTSAVQFARKVLKGAP